jgi:hypothetical protein
MTSLLTPIQLLGQQCRSTDDTPKTEATPARHCDGCGAVVIEIDDQIEAAPARWGVVWFCAICQCTLTVAEIERRTYEVSLLGLPLH